MKKIELNAAVRTETGKKAAKQSRKAELVPGNIYGGEKNMMITLSEKELRKIIYTPNVYLVTLNMDGQKVDAIVKEMQFHPVTDRILHIDFLQVDEKKKVTVALPVVLTGQAEGVKVGGRLLQVVRKLRVYGFVNDLPDEIDVDVTNLALGKSIMVSDLSYDGFTIAETPSLVIATVKATRATREAQQTEEETEE